jgi:hypothetical protein
MTAEFIDGLWITLTFVTTCTVLCPFIYWSLAGSLTK